MPTIAPHRALPRPTPTHETERALAVPEEASSFRLVETAISDATAIMRDELQLALLEVREDARFAARSFATLGAGLVAALFAASLLLTGAAFALGLVMPSWAGFLVVGGALVIAATACVVVAMTRLGRHDFRPERTIETMEENARWIGRKLS
jgi:hypothetical protein